MAEKENQSTGVILDTDIGYDADDFFALLLLLNSPELDIDLIVTGDEVEGKRFQLTKKILRISGHTDIPILAGADLGNKNFPVNELIVGESSAAADPDVIEKMKNMIDGFEKITYINIQGFSNLSALLTAFPEVVKKLKVYQMGGSLDYSHHAGWVEHNVRIDVPAAQHVIHSGVDITLVMTQTTIDPGYSFHEDCSIMKRLKVSDNALHKMLHRSVLLFSEMLIKRGITDPWPFAHDPLLASVALGKTFVDFEDVYVLMDESGQLKRDSSGHKVRASRSGSNAKEFMSFLEQRLFTPC